MSRNSGFQAMRKEYENKMLTAYAQGYQEGVYAAHAVWIDVAENTVGVGPKTREKFQEAARAKLAERMERAANKGAKTGE